MRVTREVADRVVGSKFLCVINWYDVIDGLHAGDPGHMEDDDDFITFLQEVRTYQDGEGPASRIVDEILLENGLRTQPNDSLNEDLRNVDIIQLIQNSDNRISDEEMVLKNCFGHAMCQLLTS